MSGLSAVPFLLTLKLAFFTTLILLCTGLPLAYWLSFSQSGRIKRFVEVCVSLPLVLPPSVLGFYLLLSFSPKNFIGRFVADLFNTTIPFSFAGILIGSVLFSLPFMVNPIKAGFRLFPARLLEAAYCLGKGRFETFWRVIMPNSKASLISALVLCFAHTIGEFGVVLMLGGNIPGRTRVASIAIYSEVEAMNYSSAHIYSLVLVCISFAVLMLMQKIEFRKDPVLA